MARYQLCIIIIIINVAGASIPLSTSLKLIGVHLDNNLNFGKCVNSVSKSCHFHLYACQGHP